MSNRGFLAVLTAIGFIALLAFGLVAKAGPTIAVGDQAPDAPVERLGGSELVSLADYRGQWVLLNFWASWCPPCRDEAPVLESFSREHEGEVAVIGMDSKDATGAALKFARETGMSYDLLHDDGGRAKAYNVQGFPESFLIDPEGKIAFVYRGAVDREILDSQFAPLLGGKGA